MPFRHPPNARGPQPATPPERRRRTGRHVRDGSRARGGGPPCQRPPEARASVPALRRRWLGGLRRHRGRRPGQAPAVSWWSSSTGAARALGRPSSPRSNIAPPRWSAVRLHFGSPCPPHPSPGGTATVPPTGRGRRPPSRARPSAPRSARRARPISSSHWPDGPPLPHRSGRTGAAARSRFRASLAAEVASTPPSSSFRNPVGARGSSAAPRTAPAAEPPAIGRSRRSRRAPRRLG